MIPRRPFTSLPFPKFWDCTVYCTNRFNLPLVACSPFSTHFAKVCNARAPLYIMARYCCDFDTFFFFVTYRLERSFSPSRLCFVPLDLIRSTQSLLAHNPNIYPYIRLLTFGLLFFPARIGWGDGIYKLFFFCPHIVSIISLDHGRLGVPFSMWSLCMIAS